MRAERSSSINLRTRVRSFSVIFFGVMSCRNVKSGE
jgi:hypothetical protein